MLFLLVVFATGHRLRAGLYIQSLLEVRPNETSEITYDPFVRIPSQVHPSMGSALVLHGLNLNPECMTDFSQALSGEGFEVIRGVLTGHRAGFAEMKTVTHERWSQDLAELAANMVPTDVAARGIRVGAGFSLGGLMIVDQQIRQATFQKMILLAPAITPRVPPWLVDLAQWILPAGFEIASPIPPGYGRYRKTTLNQNVALFEAVRWVQASATDNLKIPTLVLGDPEDELVDWEELKKFSQERELPWQFEQVSIEGTSLPRKVHHQIFDKPSLGEKEWARVVGLVHEFVTH